MIRRSVAAFAALCMAMSFYACGQKKEAEQPAQGTAQTQAQASLVTWMDYTAGMKKAKESGKPVIIDFYTDWCHWCVELDKVTYRDPLVVSALNSQFISIKVNAEGGNTVEHEGKKMTERELAGAYKVEGFPTLYFYDSAGEHVRFDVGNRTMEVLNFVGPEDMRMVLSYISSGASKKMSLKDYTQQAGGAAGSGAAK